MDKMTWKNVRYPKNGFFKRENQEKWLKKYLLRQQQAYLTIHIAMTFAKKYKYFTPKNMTALANAEEKIYKENGKHVGRPINMSDLKAMMVFYATETAYQYGRKLDIASEVAYCLSLVSIDKNLTERNNILSIYKPPKITWSDSFHTADTKALAQTIYDTKDWNICPILADALMDAGYEEQYTLWLLREQSQYFSRGAWILHKLLGKL